MLSKPSKQGYKGASQVGYDEEDGKMIADLVVDETGYVKNMKQNNIEEQKQNHVQVQDYNAGIEGKHEGEVWKR